MMSKAKILVVLATTVSLGLAACAGPAPTPETIVETVVVEKEVEKVVKETVEVEKEVVETVEVEVEVEEPQSEETEMGVSFSVLADDTVYFGLWDNPFTFDPQRAQGAASLWVLKQCLSPPLELGLGGQVLPSTAEYFEFSEDLTELTLYFNPDMTWSDGEPLTAHHYVHGMLRLLDPAVDAYRASMLFDIAGARAYHEGYAGRDEVGIQALDDYTLRITLEKPFFEFPQVMTLPAAWPTRPDFDYGDEEYARLAEEGIYPCNGAYRIIAYKPGDSVILNRRDDWPGADDIPVREIVFTIVPDEMARLAMYQDGRLHAAHMISRSVPTMVEDPRWFNDYNLLLAPQVVFLGFNLDKEPMSDPLVRQALSMAVPLEAMASGTFADDGTIETAPAFDMIAELPAWSVDYTLDTATSPAYDPATAQVILDETGLTGSTLRLLVLEGGTMPGVADRIAAAWGDLGLVVEVDAYPYGVWMEFLQQCQQDPGACEYDAYINLVRSPSADDWRSWTLLERFRPGSAALLGHWYNEAYADLLDSALATTDPETQVGNRIAAEVLLLQEDAVIKPLFWWTDCLLFDRDVLSYEVRGSDKVPVRPPRLPAGPNVAPQKVDPSLLRTRVSDWHKARTGGIREEVSRVRSSIEEMRTFARDQGWEYKPVVTGVATGMDVLSVIDPNTAIPSIIVKRILDRIENDARVRQHREWDKKLNAVRDVFELDGQDRIKALDKTRDQLYSRIKEAEGRGANALRDLYLKWTTPGSEYHLSTTQAQLPLTTHITAQLLVELAKKEGYTFKRSLIDHQQGRGFWSCPDCADLGKAIAKKLNDLGYFYYADDSTPPYLVRYTWIFHDPAEYRFIIRDRLSGTSQVTFNFRPGHNLYKQFKWARDTEKMSQAHRENVPGSGQLTCVTAQTPPVSGVWFYFWKEYSRISVYFDVTATDGNGNTSTFHFRD